MNTLFFLLVFLPLLSHCALIMHTRIMAEEPVSEDVSIKMRSGFGDLNMDLQGLLSKMKERIENTFGHREFHTRKSKIFNRKANEHATRIYKL